MRINQINLIAAICCELDKQKPNITVDQGDFVAIVKAADTVCDALAVPPTAQPRNVRMSVDQYNARIRALETALIAYIDDHHHLSEDHFVTAFKALLEGNTNA